MWNRSRRKMRARAIVLFALLFLLVLPLPAQNAYPTKVQVHAILKDAQSVLAQFEKVTDRIDFARWDAPHGLISQRKAELKLIRRGVILNLLPIVPALCPSLPTPPPPQEVAGVGSSIGPSKSCRWATLFFHSACFSDWIITNL